MTPGAGTAPAADAQSGAARGVVTRVAALLALARWPNALIAAAGVAVGAWWAAPDDWRSAPVGWAMVAALGITASLNAANDIADVEIDRVAHPRRPLPAGTLSRRVALRLVVAGALVALAASVGAHRALALLTPLVLAIGYGYARGSARLGVWGNVLVAMVASLPFLYGGIAADAWRPALTLAAIAAPLHFAREVAKDVADAEGDRRAGRRSLVLVHGPRASRAVAIAAVALWLVGVSFLLAPAGWRLVALVPAAALAVRAAHQVGRAPTPRPPTLLKLSMLLAMAALPLLR